VRIVKKHACARIGLLGNPSDGYFGKTISTTISNFRAEVVLYEWPELEVVLGKQDRCQFTRMQELVEDVQLNGLYGGLRLVKAAIKVFAQYCELQGISLPEENFSLRYKTDIPRQVGLAGSSAIITAVFGALCDFYSIEIQPQILANLILETETNEIGIAAGLQDRVCQVYNNLVYMDFNEKDFNKQGYGNYEILDQQRLPGLYLAYQSNLSEISGIYHNNLRERWLQGDKDVIKAMERFAEIAQMGREAILAGDDSELDRLMNENFDLRADLTNLDPSNMQMIETARKLGVSAKFAGSGGAVIGICRDKEILKQLKEKFSEIGCLVVKPVIC
jgi:galactokinase/mevalonate kinase-like predicted kinase